MIPALLEKLIPTTAVWGRLCALSVVTMPVALYAQERRVSDLSPSELYAEGVRLKESGEWQQALVFWERASETLGGENLHDPRIGIAFIETVTENRAVNQYDTASDLYLWGLGTPTLPEAAQALEQEFDRVRLIWTEEQVEEWDALREANPQGSRLALKRFWIEKDPTPSTAVNERLIEHWERIRHARATFIYNTSSPLDTDDRGVLYLKFGEAARVRRGSLGASESEMNIRISNPEERMRMRLYDTNPQYEVWVYERLNTEGFTYFLFGNTDGTGPFELVNGVHELIPQQARSRSSADSNNAGVPASYYLELFYYQDLSGVGGHFGRRFGELDRLWNPYTASTRGYMGAGRTAPQEGSLEAVRTRFQQEDDYFPPTPPQVPVQSEFEGSARDELVAQMIRTLSDDGTPILVTVGTSAPRLIATPEQGYAGELVFPDWIMRHTLIIRDSEMDEVGRLVQPLSALRADVSAFVLRHVPTPLHLTLTARTLRISEDQSDTLVAGDRLPGQAHFVPGEPLSADTALLQVSDLMTGTAIPPGIDPDALPYPLLPTAQIWRRDPLRIYFELFHIGERVSGRGELDVRFIVVPLKDDGQPDFDRDPVTLAVTLTPRADRPYRESFDMQLRDQELGQYRVDVEVHDRVRDQLVRRSAQIRIVR